MYGRLLCTFAHKSNVELLSDMLIKSFDIYRKQIFLYCNYDNPNECYLTYNADIPRNELLRDTIAIHRKKESNTLYTMNALNTIIKRMNNGILDKTFIIDWNVYEDTLILNDINDIKRINLQFIKKIQVKH